MKFFSECQEAIDNIVSGSEYPKYVAAYNSYHKIILLGNGGSNAAAAHIAQDFTKRGGKMGMAFTDPSMLTCFMNDYGVDNAYVKYLESFADSATLVILISSSGNSDNIVNCARWCSNNNIPFGILTAFNRDNKTRMASENPVFDYHIDTFSYGVAECVHQTFLHGVVECQ
jgi:D-sedoheptulose 7-phosphate isomerase